MIKYIAKRILVTIPVLIGVIFLIFVMLSVVPGDPLTVMMGEKVKVDVIERLSESMHFNDPWYIPWVIEMHGFTEAFNDIYFYFFSHHHSQRVSWNHTEHDKNQKYYTDKYRDSH